MATRCDGDKPPVPPGAGTRLYAAPELTCGHGVSCASDIFSLGVLAAEVHGGFTTAMERCVVVSALVAEAAARDASGDPLSGGGAVPRLQCDHAVALVLQLLRPEPTARPTADDVRRSVSMQEGGTAVGASEAYDALQAKDKEIAMLRALLAAGPAQCQAQRAIAC